MTRPRSQLVSLDATPYYHCVSRCVRRAFLCGNDRFSGKSYDHRKPWLLERIALLESIFAINVAAYSIMENHYHIVLHIDPAQVMTWSDDEVIARWTRLHKGPLLIQRLKASEPLTPAELATCVDLIRHFRERLADLSKFMACLNERIARMANLEDGCTGRFWEGRFDSQALLDEAALVSCMAYVDLNPIRAGIAPDLPSSDFTSIQARIEQVKPRASQGKARIRPALLPFAGTQLQQRDDSPVLPYNLKDYFELVDWTGRSIRQDKKGHIDRSVPKLLTQLSLTDAQWRLLALDIQKQSVRMLNGLGVLATIEKRRSRLAAA